MKHMLSLYLTRLYKTVSRFIQCSQLAPLEALGQSSWDLPWSLGAKGHQNVPLRGPATCLPSRPLHCLHARCAAGEAAREAEQEL